MKTLITALWFSLIFLPVASAGCLQSFFIQEVKVQYPALQARFAKVDELINKMLVQTNLSPRAMQKVEEISDPIWRDAFKQVAAKWRDKAFLQNYIDDLLGTVAIRMEQSGDKVLLEMLRRGELDPKTLQAVILERGETVAGGHYVLKTTADEDFVLGLKKGYLVDQQFGRSGHGAWVHAIQQDMFYPVLLKASGRDATALKDFLSSQEGLELWAKFFDLENYDFINSPEVLNGYLTRMLPL